MSPVLTLTTGSHFFKLTSISPRARACIDSFAKRYVQYGWQRTGRSFTKAALKVYGAATGDRNEFRFHINTLNEFNAHLQAHHITEEMLVRKSLDIPYAARIDFKIRDGWVSRPDQEPVIEYMASPNEPVAKFVNMQTGKGKSYCAMRAMEALGLRTAIVVKPAYIEKWVEDLGRTAEIAEEDIVVVQGSNQLMALLMLASSNQLTAKVIIVSNKTMQNYLKLYERYGSEILTMGYDCLPEDLFKHLAVGIRLIDEVHQDFHLNFKISLYTNVYRSISLSATLVSDDDFMNKMYAVAYPVSKRCKVQPYDKYIKATSVFYRFKNPEKVRCSDRDKKYSHVLFEQYILSRLDTKIHYLDMTNDVLHMSYLTERLPGETSLIFCATIDMANALVSHLRAKNPALDIRRYVEEDPFENLMDSEVCVTTLLSAGTAIDKANLKTVIMTTVISSSQSNLQAMGRLRKLKDPENTPHFLYYVATDIDKHVAYHEKKRMLFNDRVKYYKNAVMPNII